MQYIRTPKKSLGRSFGYCASLCLLTAASPVWSNPLGGDVVAGSATIDYGTTTVINQASDKAIINWQDFSIGNGETTQFVQPSASSVTLNRVVGGNPSEILGNLKANGQVFLVNPNGIVFGHSAQIDVAGLVASTSNIANVDFMAGNYHFLNAPDGSYIENYGNITIANAGMAVLVAPSVKNFGVIQANMGDIVLASGNAYTLDLYGDNLISFDASALVNDGLVENINALKANGGQILLTAQAADTILESLINVDGYIEANTIGEHNGKIVLQGYDNSQISISALINAKGDDSSETGGVIQASADYIHLLSDSVLDASGDAGGGDIHIGSDVFHNKGDNLAVNTLGLPTALRTAQWVYGETNSQLKANSYHSGKAGNVVVWADQATWYYGDIHAAAQGQTGDGGRIETSGAYLDVSGIQVNASSLHGKSGLWLLDPFNVDITNSTTSNGGFAGNPSTFTPTGNSAQVSAATINTTLSGGTSVLITTGASGAQTGNVTFINNTTPIAWSTAATFTVQAANDIIINASGATVVDSQYNGTATNADEGQIKLFADSDASGAGTVTFTSGNMTFNDGNVKVYTKTTTFGTANNYSADITSSGTGALTSYSLVYDDDGTVPGFTLNDINTTNLSGSYGIAENLFTNLGSFTPIGGAGGSDFDGTFDGNGFTISDLDMSYTSTNNIGLFGRIITGAVIDDVTLDDVSLTASSAGVISNLGILIGNMDAGTVQGTITITNATITASSGAALGLAWVGGAIGEMSAGTLSADISVGGTISASGGVEIGGVIGRLDGGSVTGNLTTTSGSVTGRRAVAGIIGRLVPGPTISSSTFTNAMNVTAAGSLGSDSGFGGVLGRATYVGTISTDMINNGTITATGSTITGVGGVIGLGEGTGSTLTLSGDLSSYGSVSGGSQGTGGIAGQLGNAGPGVILSGDLIVGDSGGSAITIAGTSSVGYVVGLAYASTTDITPSSVLVENTSFGSVTSFVGGVVGTLGFNSRMSGFDPSNYSIPAVVAASASYVGSVLGVVTDGTLNAADDLSALANVTGGTNTGGVIGGLLFGFFGGGNVNADLINDGYTVTGGNYTGGLIGFISNGTVNSGLTGSAVVVSTGDYSGGLVGGTADSASVTFGSSASLSNVGGSVSGVNYVGGLLGYLSNSITFSVTSTMDNAADVTASDEYAGGAVGFWAKTGTFSFNINNTGNITGNNSSVGVGGITAATTGVTFSGQLTNSGAISGTSAGSTGGLLGSATTTTIANGGNTGAVTGGNQTGGIVGNLISGTVNLVYNNATITGVNDVGGIAGISAGTINNSLFSGTVTGSGSDIGGIAGENTGTIDIALGVGTVSSGGSNRGVLVGNNTGTVDHGLYDTTFNGTLDAIGTGIAGINIFSDSGDAFDLLATYTSAGFSISSGFWSFTAGAGFYAGLDWCGTGCKFTIATPTPPTPPAPTPDTPTLTPTQTVAYNNSERILVTTDEPVDDATANNIYFTLALDAGTDMLSSYLGLSGQEMSVAAQELFDNVLFLTPITTTVENESLGNNETVADESGFSEIIEAMVDYYCTT